VCSSFAVAFRVVFADWEILVGRSSFRSDSGDGLYDTFRVLERVEFAKENWNSIKAETPENHSSSWLPRLLPGPLHCPPCHNQTIPPANAPFLYRYLRGKPQRTRRYPQPLYLCHCAQTRRGIIQCWWRIVGQGNWSRRKGRIFGEDIEWKMELKEDHLLTVKSVGGGSYPKGVWLGMMGSLSNVGGYEDPTRVLSHMARTCLMFLLVPSRRNGSVSLPTVYSMSCLSTQ
jgi:hypothetical protein